MLNDGGVALQRGGDIENFLFGLGPFAFFDGFAHPWQSLYAIAGVEARRINLMAIPRPAGQSPVVQQGALGQEQEPVEGVKIRFGEGTIGFLKCTERLLMGSAAAQDSRRRLQRREVQKRHWLFGLGAANGSADRRQLQVAVRRSWLDCWFPCANRRPA